MRMYLNFSCMISKTQIGYIRVHDRKWSINAKATMHWLSSLPHLTPLVIRKRTGPWHRPSAVPPGEQWPPSSLQDLLGYNCSTNVIVNYNGLWLRSQFRQHNDTNSSWEYWNGAAVWLSVLLQGFYCRCRARHLCFQFVLMSAWGAHLVKMLTLCLSVRAQEAECDAGGNTTSQIKERINPFIWAPW